MSIKMKILSNICVKLQIDKQYHHFLLLIFVIVNFLKIKIYCIDDNIKYLKEIFHNTMQFNTSQKKLPQKKLLIRQQSYKKLQQPKQQLLKKLLYLFTYYASKSSKVSYQDLHEKDFLELLQKVWISAKKDFHNKDNKNTVHLLNIFYGKGKKNVLKFNQFLDLLPRISSVFQLQQSQDDSMKSFLHHLVCVYQEKVYNKYKGITIDIDTQIDVEIRQFLQKICPDLKKVYELYFAHQMNNILSEIDSEQQSFACMMDFAKEFQLSPKLVSSKDIFFLYNQIMNQQVNILKYKKQEKQVAIFQDCGRQFGLSKFIQLLICLSLICFSKLNQEQEMNEYNKMYKLKLLLQHLQEKRMEKKNLKCSKLRFSFLKNENNPQISPLKVKKKQKNEQNDKIQKNKANFLSLFDRLSL